MESFAAPAPNLKAPNVQNWVSSMLSILRLRIFLMRPNSPQTPFGGASERKKNDQGILPGTFKAARNS
jgi:hypothetical protein